MPGALLAVVTGADPRGLRDALEGAPGVLGLLLMGDRVNVRVDDADAPPARAAAQPGRGAASPMPRFTRIEPGIEDVFVALVGAGTPA